MINIIILIEKSDCFCHNHIEMWCHQYFGSGIPLKNGYKLNENKCFCIDRMSKYVQCSIVHQAHPFPSFSAFMNTDICIMYIFMICRKTA